jgi:hypothetical protein
MEITLKKILKSYQKDLLSEKHVWILLMIIFHDNLFIILNSSVIIRSLSFVINTYKYIQNLWWYGLESWINVVTAVQSNFSMVEAYGQWKLHLLQQGWWTGRIVFEYEVTFISLIILLSHHILFDFSGGLMIQLDAVYMLLKFLKVCPIFYSCSWYLARFLQISEVVM